MNHIVDTCPLTKFEGGLNLLHEADDDAVIRLESTATAALVTGRCSVLLRLCAGLVRAGLLHLDAAVPVGRVAGVLRGRGRSQLHVAGGSEPGLWRQRLSRDLTAGTGLRGHSTAQQVTVL